MIKLKDLVQEALPLSVAKQFSKNWNKSRLKDWFNGKNRIYLQLVSNINIRLDHDSRIESDVQGLLSSKDYQIIDYKKGLAKNKKYNRDEKIGKILQKMKPQLLQPFNNDPARQTTKQKPIVCISRHPYDIAGMSTDRGWTSCKNLGTKRIRSKGEDDQHEGQQSEYITTEVDKLLIAYLISPNDTNIQYPIARINIVPYINQNQPHDVIFAVAKLCYGQAGVNYQPFIQTVSQWLDQKQAARQVSDGVYELDPDIYPDNNDKLLIPNSIERWTGGTRTKNWVNGVWFDGIWNARRWKGGLWYTGVWKRGIWERGTWKSGKWEDGVWQDGTWKEGIWVKGTWKNGTWLDGTWRDGTWQDGTWYDGYWTNGTWKNGTWVYGWIYDPMGEGRAQFRTTIRGSWVESFVSPAEYFAQE